MYTWTQHVNPVCMHDLLLCTDVVHTYNLQYFPYLLGHTDQYCSHINICKQVDYIVHSQSSDVSFIALYMHKIITCMYYFSYFLL